MRVLAGGLKQAAQVKNAQGACRNLSKVMTLGTYYRLFFPVIKTENGERDILAAAVPGRKLDYGKLNHGFLPLGDMFEVTESGRIIDTTGITPYARIARVFHEAECAAEKAEATDRAEKAARAMGKEIDAIALAKELETIELTYHGDRKAKPQPVYATQNPMIQGVTVETATECLVIPLEKSGEPIWGEATVASFPLSNKKIKNLTELVNNKDNCPEGAKYLEVSWSWIGADNKEAGRDAVLQGTTEMTSIATKYPESWAANAEQHLARLSQTPEAIASKNLSMSATVTPATIIEEFRKYLAKNPVVMVNIDCESEITKSAAKDILNFGLVKDIPTIQGKLLELVNSEEAEETAGAVLTGIQVEQAVTAQTIGQVAAALGENFDELAGVVGNDDIDNL